ncbi:MAG: hypothetical protein SWH68_10170 [Thermodesulfobacteriota bacterium]|nr:hypothetical protein [Thermodesulfobacteriota bacterium]
MEDLIKLFQMIIALILAVMVGNRFLRHVRRVRDNREPWYKAYMTIPGMIILLALLIPIVLRIAGVI